MRLLLTHSVSQQQLYSCACVDLILHPSPPYRSGDRHQGPTRDRDIIMQSLHGKQQQHISILGYADRKPNNPTSQESD